MAIEPPFLFISAFFFPSAFSWPGMIDIPRSLHASEICCPLNKFHKENVDRLCIRPIKSKPKKIMDLGQKKLFPRKQLDCLQRIFDVEHTLLLDHPWEMSWSPAMHKSARVQLVAVTNWGKDGWELVGAEEAEAGRGHRARR